MAAEATPAQAIAAALGEAGDVVELDEEESHYLRRVCRVRPGEVVRLTDGRGSVALARLADAGRSARLTLESLERTPSPARAVVMCGAPEGERADWLIEKLAELGVTRLVPIHSRRAVWEQWDRRRERFSRLARAALRQSRRAWLMEVADPVEFVPALDGLPEDTGRWLADAGGEARPPEASPGGNVGLVGPSQGLDPGEIDACLRRGFVRVRLSGARLRTETAAVALAAWWE